MTTDSEIKFWNGGVTYSGPDSVALYRAIVMRAGIKLYRDTGMKPNRAYTPTAMLKAAGDITGQTYKRGEFDRAIANLTYWIETMKSAIPVTREEAAQ